jgi:hypothetical protein
VLETEPHWFRRWRESLILYQITLQAAMCELAQSGRLVYHGSGGQELFPGVRHVLKILLNAPMEYRIEKLKARQQSDETEPKDRRGFDDKAARHYLEQLDGIRTRRLKAIFGVDWRDSTHYDLVINISQMSLDTAARMIVEAAQSEEYQPDSESDQAFQDLMVTARVRAALAIPRETRDLAIHVRSEKGEVHLSGILSSPAVEAEIVKTVEKVPGVVKVVSDLIFTQRLGEYSSRMIVRH